MGRSLLRVAVKGKQVDYEELELTRYDALQAWLDAHVTADEALEALADAANDE